MVLLAIATGLASRAIHLFPVAWGKYPGDALWATMMLFGVALLRPAARPAAVAGIALVISFAVEFSQLYEAGWANAIRATRVGHLVFGSGFNGMDFAAYTIGVCAGLLLDVGFFYRPRASPNDIPRSQPDP